MREKAEAWRTAREKAEESATSVGAAASTDDTTKLRALTEQAQLKAKEQDAALGKLVELISPGPGDKLFDIKRDYVGDIAPDADRPGAGSDNRRRGLKPDGAKIRNERTLKEWTRNRFLEEIKEATGEKLSTRTISRAEDGQPSDRRTLDAIARTLNLALDEIVVD